MKKWLAVVLLLVLIGGAAWFLNLPKQYNLNQQATIPVNGMGLSRNLVETQNWQQWWPGKQVDKRTNELAAFEFEGVRYGVIDRKYASLDLSIEADDISFPGQLQLVAGPSNHNEVHWTASIDTRHAAINKFTAWRISRRLKKQLQTIADKATDFYRDEKNLYALPIHEQHVTDSNLVSTYKTFTTAVGPADYYSMIDQLTAYIVRHNARTTGLPMLNITTIDTANVLVRVALPVDRRLPDSGTIVYRWMLGRGNILVADVVGGPESVKHAFREMENYVADHNRVPPAIPFQSLLTDRRAVTDSSKWKTRLYYPVM